MRNRRLGFVLRGSCLLQFNNEPPPPRSEMGDPMTSAERRELLRDMGLAIWPRSSTGPVQARVAPWPRGD